LAYFGSGLAGELGAAKLLLGMGRDNALPRGFFGHLRPGTSTPTYNIIAIGLLGFVGAEVLHSTGNALEHANEMINFGAFLAFMGVNLATFWQFAVVRRRIRRPSVLADMVCPLGGFAFCSIIWWNLNPLAKTAGAIWFAIGLLYMAATTRGFRSTPGL